MVSGARDAEGFGEGVDAGREEEMFAVGECGVEGGGGVGCGVGDVEAGEGDAFAGSGAVVPGDAGGVGAESGDDDAPVAVRRRR